MIPGWFESPHSPLSNHPGIIKNGSVDLEIWPFLVCTVLQTILQRTLISRGGIIIIDGGAGFLGAVFLKDPKNRKPEFYKNETKCAIRTPKMMSKRVDFGLLHYIIIPNPSNHGFGPNLQKNRCPVLLKRPVFMKKHKFGTGTAIYDLQWWKLAPT